MRNQILAVLFPVLGLTVTVSQAVLQRVQARCTAPDDAGDLIERVLALSHEVRRVLVEELGVQVGVRPRILAVAVRVEGGETR